MINAYLKWLKVFLVLKIKKVDFFVALIFDKCINFLDLLFLDKFIIVSLALLLLSLTTLLLSALNTFGAKSNDLVIFNKKISNAIILLKLWIKR